MNRYVIIWLVILGFSLNGSGQSVDVFIDMALENNHGLKSLRLEYDAALFKIDQVNDWPDPKVNLGIGVLPVETRLGAQRLRIGASQMIPWKGHLSAKSDVARSMAEVISSKDEVKEIDIEFAMRTAYATLQFLEAKKDIILEKLNVLDALEEMAKSAVRSGNGKLSNVLFTERKRELLNADLSLITKKIEQPTIIINRWAGRDLNTKINVLDSALNPLPKREVTSYASGEHPQFKIFSDQILASTSKIELTRYETKPKIGVGLDYAYIDGRNDVEIPGNGRDVLMPMGSISIPLHTGRYEAIRQEETVKQQAIQAKQEDTRDTYLAEIEMAFSSIEYADQVIEKYQALKDITSETLKLMRTEYASEGTRFEELLRLEMELIEYDHEIEKAHYDKNLAIATLYKFR